MVLTGEMYSRRFVVKDQSYVGTVRRAVKDVAEEIGMSSSHVDKLNVVSTELATNLAKHATDGGEIIVIDDSTEDAQIIRLLSIDRGPGIENLDQCLADGSSTTDTLGGGLGAMRRLSHSFEISSEPGKGTVIQCIMSQPRATSPNKNRAHNSPSLDIGLLSVPHPGETVCGDALEVMMSNTVTSILVVDALGHGPRAHDASRKAIETFRSSPFDDPIAIVERIHSVLATTCGAALALVHINQLSESLDFVGVGNVDSRIYSRYSSTGLASIQGIVGSQTGTLKKYTEEWHAGDCLLMYSDGIKSSAKVKERILGSAHLAAAEIYRDFSRASDDATIVVARDKRGL